MSATNNWDTETDFEIVAITAEQDPEVGEVKETDIEITKDIEFSDESDEQIFCRQNTPEKIKILPLKIPKEFLPKRSDQLFFLKIQDKGINKFSEGSLVASLPLASFILAN